MSYGSDVPGAVWDRVASAAVGTAKTVPELAGQFDISEDFIETELGNLGVEVCSGCGYWFIDGEGHPDVLCDDCVTRDD